VERSLDEKQFARLGAVAADSNSPRAYALADERLPAGAAVLYYRLRQLDTDGPASLLLVRANAQTARLVRK